jgi:hypothetical protein
MQNALLQYGALGILALVAIISAKGLFDRLQEAYISERARADRCEEQLRQLNEIMRTDYVTALNHASQAIADANRAVGDALAAVRRDGS